MKIASHNTMTYLKPDKWYMYPFRFIAKCQSKTVVEQYESGVRFFDIRIGFDKYNNPKFKHGLISFKSNINSVISYLTSKDDVIIRIIAEDDNPMFNNFCNYLEGIYGYRFCGGNRKSDWKKVYNFNNKTEYTIKECYSSMPSNPKWYGIFPWLYAKLHNKKVLSEKYNEEYLMIDFI